MKRFQVKINDTDVIHILSFNSVNNLTSRGGKFTLKCLDLTGTFYDSISSGDEIKLFENYTLQEDWNSYSTSTWTNPQPTEATIVDNELKFTDSNSVFDYIRSNKESFFNQTIKARVKFADNLANLSYCAIGFHNRNAQPNAQNLVIDCLSGDFRLISRGVGAVEVTTLTGEADTNYHDIEFQWCGTGVKFYLDGVLRATHTTSFPTLKCYIEIGNKSTAGNTTNMYIDYIYVGKNDNIFGGYLENIKREVKNGKLVEITGNDYTAKLHNLMIFSQVYRKRELSVMVRDLAFDNLIVPVDVDSCDATTGWAVSGDVGTLTLDTASDTNGNPYARLGTGCIKGLATYSTGTGSFAKTITTGITLTGTDSFGAYVFIEDKANISKVTLLFGQDVSNTYKIELTDIETGWNYFVFKLEFNSNNAGTPTYSGVDYFELKFTVGASASSEIIRIDNLKKLPRTESDFRIDKVQITEVYLEDALFRNLTLFQCYQRLCSVREELYDFYIDIDKCINFGEFGTVASGETIERGTNLISAKFDDNPKKLFNDVVLYGGRQNFTFNEKFNGDGANDTFTIQYEPVNAEVSVGGVIQKGYKPDSGETFDYKVDIEAKQIIFEVGSIPAGGTNNVDITYAYSVPTVVRKKNSESIVKYGLRQTKLENPLITTVTDGKEVVSSFLDKNKDPLEVGKLITLMNTNIDVGETIQFIDTNLFSSTQTLTVIEVANYFIGKKPHTELTVTEDSETVEDFLVEIFRRLNAVEEIDKGISEITTQLETYSEDEALADAAANLVVKSRVSAGFILGHPTLGLIGNNIGSNTNAYGGDITSGKSG